MKLPARLLWAGAALILAALIIASLLRDVVEQFILRPLLYLGWLLGVIYHIIPQPVIWMLLLLALLYISLGNFVSRFVRWPGKRPARRAARGPLEDLAQQIERRADGVYYKWSIARDLAGIALDIDALRLHTRRRWLTLDDLPADAFVRRYLDAALNSSFADYPGVRTWRWLARLKPPARTNLDGDLAPVIDYLESKMENEHDIKRS